MDFLYPNVGIILKWIWPIFLVVSMAWLFSVSLIPQLIIIFLAGIVQTLMTYQLLEKEPYLFSKSFNFIKETKSAKSFLLALITGLFYGAHYLALKLPYGLPIYFSLLLGAVVIGWLFLFPRIKPTQLVG